MGVWRAFLGGTSETEEEKRGLWVHVWEAIMNGHDLREGGKKIRGKKKMRAVLYFDRKRPPPSSSFP